MKRRFLLPALAATAMLPTIGFAQDADVTPNNADIVNLFGDFLLLSGNFSKALKMESRAIELDPLAAVHWPKTVGHLYPFCVLMY